MLLPAYENVLAWLLLLLHQPTSCLHSSGQTIHFHLKQIRPLHTGISLQNSLLVNHFIMQTQIVLCTIVHCELFAIAVFQKLEEDSGNGILEFPTLLIQVFEGHRYEIVTDSIPAECLTQKLEQCS